MSGLLVYPDDCDGCCGDMGGVGAMSLKEKAITIKCNTYSAEIYMAGDINHCRHELQRMAASEGMCVSLESVDYIYTGGMEQGFVIRLINYPRFQSSSGEIKDNAIRIAETLLEDLGQGSCSVVCSDETIFISRRNND